MSNRRRPAVETFLDNVVAQIGDRRIPGGCDDCHACQTVSKTPGGWYECHIWHDDSCPWLLSRNRAAGAAP
jgi:hypothetical protein